MCDVRIVIADDDVDLLKLLERLVRKAAYTVTTCENGDDAFEHVLRSQPVILLADWNMPGQSGIELCWRVRAALPEAPVHILLMTGNDSPEQIAAGLEAGADDYLVKPVHPVELLARIRAGERILRLLVQQETRTTQMHLQMRALEATADAIVITDHAGRIEWVNAAFTHLTGYSREESRGMPTRVLQSGRHDRPFYVNLWKSIRSGNVWRGEIVNRRKDGQLYHEAMTITPVRDGGGAISHYIAVKRDVTDRRQAEEDVRRAHQRSEALLSSISAILIGVDDHGRVTRWNEPAEAAFGIRAADVIGRPFPSCGIQWDWSGVAALVRSCLEQRRTVRLHEIRFRRRDGANGFLDISFSPVQWEAGCDPGFLAVAADITECKVLQGQLAQALKLESIGLLAAGIAHEINTPTQFVGDNTRFLRDAFRDLDALLAAYDGVTAAAREGRLTPDLLAAADEAARKADVAYLREEVPRAIEQSIEGVERVARIVRAMKDFSHPGGTEKQAVDLNKAIESTVTVARNEWKYVADMTLDFDPELPPVPCLLGNFNQVILNIVVNAAHAIADVVGDGAAGKGMITITTRRDGDWAEIRIRDTGTGIAEEHRGKIFDHFFTTKEVGKGTGQGLSLAYSVVTEEHGGALTFQSEVGRGTTFIIRLPIEPAKPESAEARNHEEAHTLC